MDRNLPAYLLRAEILSRLSWKDAQLETTDDAGTPEPRGLGGLLPCLLASGLNVPAHSRSLRSCPLELAETQSQVNTGGLLRRLSKDAANHRAGAFLVLSAAAVSCWWPRASLGQPGIRGGSFVGQAGRGRPNRLGKRNGWSNPERSGGQGNRPPGLPIHWQHKEHFIFCFCSHFLIPVLGNKVTFLW